MSREHAEPWQASGAFGPVDDELAEPLLVDPLPACGHDGERLPIGDAVLGDLAAGDERHPAVTDKQRGTEEADQHGDEGREHDEERVLDREGDESPLAGTGSVGRCLRLAQLPAHSSCHS